VVLLGGTTPTAGRVTATLSTRGDTLDGSERKLVGGYVSASIASDGTVPGLVLVPNDAITGSTFYSVAIDVTSPARSSCTVKWLVATSPDPVNLRAITRLDSTPSCLEPL